MSWLIGLFRFLSELSVVITRELVKDCLTFPSGALKEQFLVLLESNAQRSMKVLANALKIDTVRELVSNYEECHGQVSLDTWKYVLQQLGYSKEHFQQLVSASQIIPDATVVIDGLEEIAEREENLAASGVQADYKQQSLDKTTTPSRPTTPESPRSTRDPVVTGQHRSRQNNAVAEPYPPGNGEQDLEYSSKTQTTKNNITAENDCIENNSGLHAELQKAAAENDPSHENNDMPSTVQPLSQGNTSRLGLVRVENGRRHHENSTVVEIAGREEVLAASGVQADYKQQSFDKTTTSSRPTTPESPCSTHEAVVTGQYRSCQNNAVVEHYPPGNGEQDLEYSSKTPTTNDCTAENDCRENNNGLYAELQKANESLQLNVCYLVQELRKKDLDCARLRNECSFLQQQLQESRGQYTELQIINEEFERRLEESAELENESQQLIRMIEEVCILKAQENNRLEEHIRQLDQRLDSANRCMEDLRRERQEMSEELRSAFNQMQYLQERYHNLEREREQSRLCYEDRMAEAARAFTNAETDKVKRLKQKLKGKNSQLEAFVKELRSKEDGHFRSGDSGEDDAGENPESSSTASSEVEDNDQLGSSNHNQQSDSDSSSEADGFLEDASTDATESERQK